MSMIGNRIGPYQLMEILGEGGMGEVYLAEQSEPVRRFVALKIIKLGMDSKQVVGRFESERQTLAMMEHPNIATVLDAGLSPEGRPYFVMEYVKGVPVTEYCDRHRLPTARRLELFLSICEAVQHAHQKGIIHRDLKPGNALVTIIDNRPVPKVIDFGVAKATARELTTGTLFTEHGQLVGTPEYMSPEQAEMTAQDIDTRTDIYSLGVLLYELIVGALPFESRSLRAAGLAEIQRILREEDPPRPSTRLSTLDGSKTTELARDRATAIAKLRRQVEGDLDWITMRAMEKDRTRRYASASEMAADIRRHLRDEPVLASPPSWRYRARKFVRRNRAGVTAAALIALALVAGIAGTAWQAVRATKAEERSRRSEQSALAVNRFLLDTIGQSSPLDYPGEHDVPVSQALDRASQNIEGSYGDQPLIEAAVRYAVGISYRHLARYEKSEMHLRRAVELRDMYQDELPDRVRARLALGNTLRDVRKLDEARELYAQCVREIEAGAPYSPAQRVRSYKGLGNVAWAADEFAQADSLYELALAVEGLTSERDLEARFTVLADQALLKTEIGLWSESREIYQRLFEELDAREPGDHPWKATILSNLSDTYEEEGDYEEAERLQRQSVEMNARIYGEGHAQTAESLGELGQLLRERGKYEEAEIAIRECIEACQTAYGRNHEFTARSINNLGALYQEVGDLDAALEAFEQVREIQLDLYGDDPAKLATVNNNLAAVYRQKEDYDRALESFRLAREGFMHSYGEDHARVAVVDNNIARTYMDAGQYDAAEAPYRSAILKLSAMLTPEHPNVAIAKGNLGENLRRAGRHDEAEPLLLEAYEILASNLGPSHKRSLFVADALAKLYGDTGRGAEAAQWRERAQGK